MPPLSYIATGVLKARKLPHTNSKVQTILGNPGLQRGREGKGETGSGKKGGGGVGILSSLKLQM